MCNQVDEFAYFRCINYEPEASLLLSSRHTVLVTSISKMWVLTLVVLGLSMTYVRGDDCGGSDLVDKSVLITGAARGIGRAICDNILKNGAKFVIIVDNNRTNGENAESKFNEIYGEGKVKYYYGDVATNVETLFPEIINNHGYIDVFIANAGVVLENNIRRMIDVNTLGAIEWSMAANNVMSKENGGKGGTIIAISSSAAFLKIPFIIGYTASKAAILHFIFGLGHNYTCSKTGVRALAICPGLTHTAMTEEQMVIDSQVDIWNKFKAVSVWQEADHVGKCVVDVFKTGYTGTAWAVEDNKEASIAPAEREVTAETLWAL